MQLSEAGFAYRVLHIYIDYTKFPTRWATSKYCLILTKIGHKYFSRNSGRLTHFKIESSQNYDHLKKHRTLQVKFHIHTFSTYFERITDASVPVKTRCKTALNSGAQSGNSCVCLVDSTYWHVLAQETYVAHDVPWMLLLQCTYRVELSND